MTEQRILITGGAGFIGSHLTERLLTEDCSVTVIDNLSTGRWANIDHLKNNPRLRVIIASAQEEALMQHEIAQHDFVYHLASAVGVKLIIERPVATVETIFHATDVVLRACSKFRRPMLLASTSEVYGKSTDVPFRESSDVVMGPTEKRRWAYACAKALDEFLALAHFYETALPVYIVRLFNTVGPRQTGQYGMVLPTFVTQALADSPMTVFGDGTQQRCFCNVHDVVDALQRFRRAEVKPGMIINIGSQEEVAIAELAERVRTICKSRSEVKLIPYDAAYGPGFDDMARRVPSLERAEQLLGWKPSTTLDETIRQVADWTKSTSS